MSGRTLMAEALDALRHPLLITDEQGRVRHLNAAAQRLTGWSLSRARLQPLDSVVPCRHPLSGESYPISRYCEAGARGEGDPAVCRLLTCRDGHERYVTASVDCMLDAAGNCCGRVVMIQDATDLRELAFHAAHDTLTGLVNRREFERRLQHLVDRARTDGSRHAVCFLDLDRFKAVNDRAGHRVGDVLLRQLAQRLAAILRNTDVIGRQGGDEFVVALADCPIANARQIARAMRDVVERFRFRWNGRVLQVGVSIGIAQVNPGTRSVPHALQCADAACYQAKRMGPNRIVVFGDEASSSARD